MTPAVPMPAGVSRPPLPAPWFLLPLLVTGFLCLWSLYPVSIESALVAFTLFVIPAAGYLRWQAKDSGLEFPLFAAVASMYWLYFCFGYFLGNRKLMGIWGAIRLDDRMLSLSLTMAGAGVVSMALGYTLAMPLALRRRPVLREIPRTGPYLRALLVVGSILTASESSAFWLGAGGRQIMTLLRSFVPLIAFAHLFRMYLNGASSASDRAVLLLYSAVSIASTIASGWLGPLFGFFVVATAVHVMVRRRLPLPALSVAAAAFLFFQAGKDVFRNNYWYRGEGTAGKFERVSFWMNESAEQWRAAINAPDSEPLHQIVAGSLGRVSLLEQTANVLQLTPSPVPFQNGATYAYMLVSLIPRFLWPDKPSVNDANRFYQVAYGLTAERDLDRVSIAVGSLTESYVNFGWPGVFGVMFLLGLFLRLFERVFLSENSGPFLTATGLALTPSLLVVEAQAAQYIGGLIQYVLIGIAVFLPILELRRPEETP